MSLVGESGCGKTTVSRCIVRALQPSGGAIRFRAGDGKPIDIAQVPKRALKPFRRHMQMIFQDPFSSLNPRMMIGDIIGEPLLVNGMTNRSERRDRVRELLGLVQLPAAYMNRFPHACSGGQRQRIGIARALALNPSLIVADEPVSALDVSVQAQIVNLLLELQDRLGLSYLFIAHDLSVVKHVSDRVAVMYVGKIVEVATTGTLYAAPLHPYTEALLSAVPKPDPRFRAQRIILQGEVADPAQSAARLRLPPALPLRRRALPRRGAGAERGRAGPLGELPSQRGARPQGRRVELLHEGRAGRVHLGRRHHLVKRIGQLRAGPVALLAEHPQGGDPVHLLLDRVVQAGQGAAHGAHHPLRLAGIVAVGGVQEFIEIPRRRAGDGIGLVGRRKRRDGR